MKRILILLAFIALVASVNAQSAINTKVISLYTEYTGTDANADTLTDTGTITRYWNINRDNIYLFKLEVDMDETSGTSGIHTIWSGSMNGTDNWTALGAADTLTADGTTDETDLSTGVVWRYLKLVVTGYGTTTWDMDAVKLKIVGKND